MAGYKQLREIWQSFAFTKLLQTFKMAIVPSKLVTALLALLIACSVGWIMDLATYSVTTNPDYLADSMSKSKMASELHDVYTTDQKNIEDLISNSEKTNELHIYIANPNNFEDFITNNKTRHKRQGVFTTLWDFCTERFNRISVALLSRDFKYVITNIEYCTKAIFWAVKYHTIYSLIYFSIIIAVGSIAGGAICRCAALDFSQGAKPGFTETISFSLSKFKGLLIAPLLPVAIMLTIGSMIFLLGLIGNIPIVGEIVIAIGLLPAFVIGLVLSFALIGTIAGSTLMYPAIAYEGSDGFDAISRSFAYIFARPLSMFSYSLIASIYGAFCHLLVRFFAFLLLIITYSLIALGLSISQGGMEKLAAIWPKPGFFNLLGTTEAMAGNWSQSLAAFLIHLSVMLPVLVVAAFVISFHFCACTIIYALLRRNVDNTPINEVYTQLSKIHDTEENF